MKRSCKNIDIQEKDYSRAFHLPAGKAGLTTYQQIIQADEKYNIHNNCATESILFSDL